MSYDEQEQTIATVAELGPRMKRLTVTFKVVEKGEEREVFSRKSNETHRVADAIVADSTACVTVPLWNESIDEVEAGKTYTLENGYTGLFKGHLRLNIGRYGKITAAEEEIEEVNTENDMSEPEHEREYRPRRSYGGGGGGYGGGRDRGRGGGGYGSRDRGRGRRY
jgi:replication factor A1